LFYNSGSVSESVFLCDLFRSHKLSKPGHVTSEYVSISKEHLGAAETVLWLRK